MTQEIPETNKDWFEKSHKHADTDSSWRALHHTLGFKPNQAAPGDHVHDGSTSRLIPIPEGMPLGAIIMYPGSTPPSGYFICDGSAISRTTYADLFAIMGTNYGAGDGSTTFNLPDMRVRVPVGAGTGRTLGSSEGIGEASRSSYWSHSHGHSTSSGSGTGYANISASGSSSSDSHSHFTSGTTGSGGSHSHSGSSGGPSGTVFSALGTGRESGGPSHSHPITVGTGGSHNHSFSGSSGSDTHSHSISVSASDSGHSHSVSVSVSSGGSSTHPYTVVNYIVKHSNAA